MAFAYYFSRNLESARLLLEGFESEAFKTRLESVHIGLAFDRNACETSEGKAALDLVIRLIGRLYPNVILTPLDGQSRKALPTYERFLKELNPAITIAPPETNVVFCLVLGKTAVKAGSEVVYIGSDGWLALLSSRAPLGFQQSENPFGAGAAACLGVANVFRMIFAAEIKGGGLDSDIRWSTYDLARDPGKSSNPPLHDVSLGSAHLAGAGAIGNGFLWALGRAAFHGELHVIDHEKLASSNLQRYVMALPGDEDRYKSGLAAFWLRNSGLSVVPHRVTWEEYVAARGDWQFLRVFAAVDTPQARINIQACLPYRIVNAWTQAGEIGVSRHDFLGDHACLACLYLPSGSSPNFDQVVTRALRLPDNEAEWRIVRERLERNVPTDIAYLERVAAAASIPIERLRPYEGRSLRELYSEAVCGGAILEFNVEGVPDRAEVPMAFQSALAGILLAAEWVASQLGRPALPTITQINLLTSLPKVLARPQRKEPQRNCICLDADFIAAFKEKYEGQTTAVPGIALGKVDDRKVSPSPRSSGRRRKPGSDK